MLPQSRVLARRALVLGLLAAVAATAAGFGLLPVWPGLPHLVALPPLDLFTDLRMLVPEATGYPSLLTGLAAAVGVRTAVLALLLGGLDRRRLGFALRFYLAALPVALLAALVTYTGHAGLYSGLHWIGMGLALLALVVMGAAPWTGDRRLGAAMRAAWRAGFRVWPVLAYSAALVALGGAAFGRGPWAWLAATLGSAALTLAALRWLSRPVGERPRLWLAAAGAVVVGAAAALVLAAEPGPDRAPGPRAGSLLAMSGMNSASGEGAVLEVNHPTVFGFACNQVYYFSYAGPGPGQPQGKATCPIRTGAP